MRVVKTPAGARSWFAPEALAGWMDGIDYRNSVGAGLDGSVEPDDDAPPDAGPVDFGDGDEGVKRKSEKSEKPL